MNALVEEDRQFCSTDVDDDDVYRVSAKDASFELRLHLIYLINDILHHWFVLSLTSSVSLSSVGINVGLARDVK